VAAASLIVEVPATATPVPVGVCARDSRRLFRTLQQHPGRLQGELAGLGSDSWQPCAVVGRRQVLGPGCAGRTGQAGRCCRELWNVMAAPRSGWLLHDSAVASPDAETPGGGGKTGQELLPRARLAVEPHWAPEPG
jgi:hypothetical protein